MSTAKKILPYLCVFLAALFAGPLIGRVFRHFGTPRYRPFMMACLITVAFNSALSWWLPSRRRVPQVSGWRDTAVLASAGVVVFTLSFLTLLRN